MARRRLTDRILDLDTLEVLDRVAATGSLTRAAHGLGITQQAVSARITAAETAVDARLLDRTNSGSILTPDGLAVLELAHPVLEASRRLEAGLARLGHGGRGTTVAASQTIAEFLLPGWLEALGAPRTIRLIAGNSADTVEAVRDGVADLGFIETPDLPTDLHCETLEVDELVLVTAPDHLWVRRVSVTLADLADTPLLVREPGSGTRTTLDRRLLLAGLEAAEPAAVLGTTAVIRANLLAGVAPAMMSLRTVADDLGAGRLVRIPLDDEAITRPLTAIRRGGRLPDDAQDLLRIALATSNGRETPPR